jgi:hypothetical protein
MGLSHIVWHKKLLRPKFKTIISAQRHHRKETIFRQFTAWFIVAKKLPHTVTTVLFPL